MQVENIHLGNTLVNNQGIKENTELVKLVTGVLNEEKSALKKLIDLECGGSSGCYDLGFILTQLVYEIKEQNFVNITNEFDKTILNRLAGLIDFGLEYGHKLKTDKIEEEFPLLRELINQKYENIEFLRLSYNDLQKYSCLYSKSEGEYWNKNLHLATNIENKIAFVKLKSEPNRIEVPLFSSKEISDNQEFEKEHIFKNDSIEISIKTILEKSNVMSTLKYSNNVSVKNGKELSKYKMISYCKDK